MASETFVDRFRATARRHRGRLAVQDAEASLTYGALLERVDAIAAELGRRVQGPGSIAVLAPHDIGSAAALIGALASGRGVIPLDPDHPEARNRLVAQHSGAAAVVTVTALSGPAHSLFNAGAEVIEVDRPERAARTPLPTPPGPQDLAYVLYTSGSTGAPKGVFQLHGPLLDDLVHSVRDFGLAPRDRAAVVYPPAVAAGLRALLGTLLSGASAHFLRPRTLGGRGLAREIRTRRITVFRSSATLFRGLVDAAGPGELDSLTLVALGGDRVDWADYDAFRRACRPQARFASHLGATECSLYAAWFVDEAARGAGGALPVGRAVPGYRVSLLGSDGAEVPPGEVGEVVVEGPRLARGYWADPKRTAEAFAPFPGRAEPAYRTGDLARLRPDGLYAFEGRRDQQVKLRGYRIEVGEIEAAIRACSGVKDGAVLARRRPDGAVDRLVAYVEPQPGMTGLLPRHICAMLEQKLPAHMVPAEIKVIERLPWLANFKIDRQRLDAIDQARARRPTAAVSDPLNAEIMAAVQAVLRLKPPGPEDDLLSLGGDSLQAVDIALELERRLGVPIAPETLDMACPIGELAARMGLRRSPSPAAALR